MFAGDWGACKMQVESVYAAMDRLKPKRMVVTECGHAYRATVIGRALLGGVEIGKPPIDSFHYVEWVAEALRTGKLKIDPAKKIKEPVTYQDSCNYVRNGGLADCAREIMSYIAEDFREMTPCKEHNFCCGGGGGFNGIGKYRQQRNKGLVTKRDQILATGAKLVVAPCHNCWDAIRDMEEVYKSAFAGLFSKPLLLKMVIVPDHLKPED
jgi:Fe-S oxidoreductase